MGRRHKLGAVDRRTEGDPEDDRKGPGPLQAQHFFFFNPHLRTRMLTLRRREGRDRDVEKQHRNGEMVIGCLSLALARDQTRNPGMSLHGESNLQPFAVY